jgi:hypothetical protein
LANTEVDSKFKDLAVRAAEWAATDDGQEAARKAVEAARETVRAIREAQKIDLSKACKFVL